MSQQHPITPPDKQLVRKWIEDWAGGQMKGPVSEDQLVVATQAAQWGWDQRGAVNESELQKARDQELEDCCEQLKSIPSLLGVPLGEMASNALRNACRSKQLSLKEQALEALGPEPLPETGPTGDTILNVGTIERHRFLRRALETLND